MSDEIRIWLDELGLGQYADVFARHEVVFEDLSELDDKDLKEIGIPLGPRKRILKTIRLKGEQVDSNEPDAQESQSTWERHPNERKPATVLFADIVGSTALTENMDSEDSYDMLEGARQRMCTSIVNNRGTLCRVMGDGVMAVFGAPMASEIHALEACGAAIEMQQAIRDYSEELVADHGNGLEIRVGLHSGEIVVIAGSDPDRNEYDVEGPTVPIAARMEQSANPGEIYLTSATYLLTGNRAEAEEIDPISVKGISNPIQVYILQQIRSEQETINTSQRSRFVGRRTELSQFRGILNSCVSDGQGQTVYVRGEPGIGKTRLVEELSKISIDSGLSVYRGLVLPFGVGKGQDAIRAIVRNLLDLTPGSITEERQQAALKAQAEGSIEPDQAVFLNDLLDLDQPAEQRALYDAMKNEVRNEGKQFTVSTLLANTCESKPILVIVEDVHWADAVTLAHIASLAKSVADLPALLLLTSRIDGDQLDKSWRSMIDGSPMTTIDIGPLRSQDSLELISEYIDESNELAVTCLARAAGNPLFLEQLLRSALDNSEGVLPDSIQSLVLARLDRLDPQDKQALQAASIIGQRFDADTLNHLLDNANYDIQSLVERNLVRPEGTAYLFSHALIQESVYSSLVKGQRQTLHGRAAGWFEGSDPVLFAQHLERAGDKRAPRAYLEAAQSQSEHYRIEHALQLLKQGIKIATTVSDKFELICLKGKLLHDLGSVSDSMKAYRECLKIADSAEQRCRAYIGLASGMRIKDKLDRALEILDEAESEAIQDDLKAELSSIYHLRGNLFFPMGKANECVQQHKLSLELARKIGSPELEAMALGGIGDGHYAQGKIISSIPALSECIEISRRHGFGRIEVANLPMLAGVLHYKNDLRKACDEGLLAVDLARKVGHSRGEIQAHIVVFMARFELGDLESTREHTQLCSSIVQKLGAKRFAARCLLSEGRIALAEGKFNDAVRVLETAMDVSRETGIGYIGAGILGTLALAYQDSSKREAALKEGEKVLKGGCVSHNYFEFYQDAMEACLETDNWDGAEYYASELERCTVQESLPRTEFFIRRGRNLASFGRGNRDVETVQHLQRLTDEALSAGLVYPLTAMQTALSSV